jgi:hypothetical protein
MLDGTPAVVLGDLSDPDALTPPNTFVDTRADFFDECSDGCAAARSGLDLARDRKRGGEGGARRGEERRERDWDEHGR